MIKLAVTITVKNDHTFITNFINYYKIIGFDKIIIFDDGSSKTFLNKIPKYSFVTVIKKNKSYELDGVEWLIKIKHRYYSSFDVRKRFNTYYACNLLKKERFDWLLSCDVDEFVGSFKDKEVINLKESLTNVKVPQILFLTRDIVFDQNKSLFENTKFRSIRMSDYWLGKFYEVLLFKLNSSIINKFYKEIFNLIFGKKISNLKLNGNKTTIPINPSYLGHKSLINLNFYENNHFNIHYWEYLPNYRKLPYKVLGALYHFDLVGSREVYKKFRKRADTVAFNGPEYRNLLEAKAKILSFKEFRVFYNNYLNTYNDVDTIEIKQIMSLLKNEQQT